MRRTLTLVCMASLAFQAFAQAPLLDAVSEQVEKYLQNPADDGPLMLAVREALRLSAMQVGRQFLQAAQRPDFRTNVVAPAERVRFDRQAGASANTGGGTALVARAAGSGFLNAALESGAFQRTTDGTVTTFRLNALRAYRFLTHTNAPGCSLLAPGCQSDEANPWRGLSAAVSFDPNRKDRPVEGAAAPAPPAASPIILTRARNNVTGASVRYELYWRRHYLSKDYEEKFLAALDTPTLREKAGELTAVVSAVSTQLISEPDYIKFRATVVAEAKSRPQNLAALHSHIMTRARAFVERWAGEQAAAGQPENRQILINSVKAWTAYRAARDEALEKALFRKALTAEYSYQRPSELPEFSNVRLIGGFPLGSYATEANGAPVRVPAAELTFNIGFNFYHTAPEPMNQPNSRIGRIRDAQVAFQLDRKLHEWRSLGQPVFTLAGYYQYMFENAVIQFNQEAVTPNGIIELPRSAAEILNTKGSIGIFQAKLTLPIGPSGVSMPIGFSWANRTELIKANEVRGQFGFLFDLDKLLALRH